MPKFGYQTQQLLGLFALLGVSKFYRAMGKSRIIKILEQYENSRVKKDPLGVCYCFANAHCDYLELYVWEDGKELRFIDDNFPLPRRCFSTNVPVLTIEDFENDLKRMKIEIPKRKVSVG